VTFADGSKAKDVIVRNYANGRANDLTVNGPVRAAEGISLINDEKDLKTTGSLTGGKEVKASATNGSVTIGGDVQSGTSTEVSAVGGNVEIKGRVNSGTPAKVSATNGSVSIGGSVTGGTSVTVQATEGNVTIHGTIESRSGDTQLSASDSQNQDDKGNISVLGTLTASGSAAVSTDYGSITIGSEDRKGTVKAGNQVTLTTVQGPITVHGIVEGKQGAEAQVTETGSIAIDGDLMATESGDAVAETKSGDVTIDGQVEAKTGDATVKTGSGDVLVKGKLDAGSDATLQSDNGSVTMGGNVQAGRDLQARTQTGGMVFQGNVGSGRDLTAATSQGDITFDGKVEAGRNLDTRTRQEGTITLRQDVTGGANLQFATNDGSIRFEGNDPQKSEDIHVISKDGDVSMTITGRGNMEDSHRQAGGDRAVVEADSGSITLKHTSVGDVDLYSLLAGKKAGVEVEDGSLYLDTINGNLIAVYVKNPQKTATIEHMEAGSRLSLSGSTIHVAEIRQRPGASSTLTLDVDGADQAAPMENLTIGDIKAANGVRIPHLWVRNGAVKTSQGTLQLDKLFVLDKATFSNGTMITDVFGTTPRTDERVYSVYWINTKLGRPQENLSQWLAEAGRGSRWMYLLFDRQGHTQFSNGNLVDLDPHNYVYNQRYSETNWTRTMEDRDFSNFWTPYFHPELTYSSRYDLVDGSQAVSQPANGEIIVEEV
ncbi:hypothetical protein, partial [Acidaminococcus timonensis]|uniref:hypothetical protein n=1 Tax=Acidaminococcus timonensis TaxID=1871002 RepID=UPI0030800D31